MSAEEAVATTAPPQPTPPADLAAMLQQIQAMQQQQQTAPAASAPPNPLANLEALLSTASLANLASGGALNPLSLLALTSSLNQSSPVYQGIARVLLTMNMGQMLATHQTSELLATMNQQETLMALLAARGAGPGLPFQLPTAPPAQPGFAVPLVPHMSLKRSAKEVPVAVDRKKSCPPMVAPPAPPPPPPAPRSPSPPPKSMFENLPPEMKEKNEMFRKEILRRLDIILLEELGADDEEDEKKPIPTSEEDDVKVEEPEDMGSTGSAFRRILSRSSTMGNNSNSPSASGTTTPSTGSLSSGQDSPPLEVDPLSPEMVEMIQMVAKKQKESSDRCEILSLKSIGDETVFSQNFPSMWSGGLGIKSNAVRVKLHLVNGSQEFLMSTLGRGGSLQREAVKITQRLRLDNGQVEHLHGILTEPQFACCLAFVESSTPEEHATYESVLQTSFIDYLKAKSIAGTSSLPPTDVLAEARAHIFPPGELVDKYVAELAPALYNYLFEQNTKYLFVVFTDDKVKPNMNTAPPALTVDPLPC